MKLSKKTRATLRRRKLTKFRWSAFEPKQGRTYSLEGTGERIRIVAVAQDGDGYQVAALIVDDPNRLLPVNVGDYETEPIRVLRDGPIPEPEAIDAQTQAQFSVEGREKRAENAARADALHAEAEQLRRDAPEVGRELWQAQARINVARLKLNHKRGTLDLA